LQTSRCYIGCPEWGRFVLVVMETEPSPALVVVELEKLWESFRTILVKGVMVKVKLDVQDVMVKVKYSIQQ